jgi:hypothetical protein
MASRITRKSAAPKLKRFQITAEALPGAIFFSLPSARPNRRRSSPVLIYNSAKASRLKAERCSCIPASSGWKVWCRRRDSAYASGRGNSWLKKTCAQRETLTIAGFALDEGKWDGI